MAPTNKKTQGRQTNNSLSSMTEHIVINPQNTGSTSEPPRKKKSVTNNKKITEVFAETDEVLQIGMHKVLEHVKNHDDAWPFMDPVDEDIAPRYYSIIRRPMDLQKMEEKLDNAEYNSYTEFKNDFKLIVNNCRLYNGQNNEYTDMVNNLQIAFEKATRKYFDHNSSDEETFFDFLDVKNDAFHEKVLSEKIKNKKLLQLDIEPKSDYFQMKNKQTLKNDENNHVKEKKRIDNAKNKFDQIKICESVSPKKEVEITSYNRNNDDPKFVFDNIESSLKRKDKKKIIKAIKKKHKTKDKIKSKIRKERGRPKGSHKNVDKVKSVQNKDDNAMIYEAELESDQEETSDKRRKKAMYKLIKKDKEKKSKYKDISKIFKKHSKDELLECTLSLLENEQNLVTGYDKKNKQSNIKKITDQADDRQKDQKSKKKSKKKNKDDPSEKRKPGRPKLKHDQQYFKNNEAIDYKKKKEQTFKKYENEIIRNCTTVNRSENSDKKLNEVEFKTALDLEDEPPGQSFTSDIIDKYDLIKQRRRQKQNIEAAYSNNIPVNKSASKSSESEDEMTNIKMEDKKKYKSEDLLKNLSHKESKNQRLQDTIEKLKKKSKKNKKENALLDEIFKIKPGKPIDDEKSIYKKIRETYGATKNHDSQKIVSEREQKNVCEYDFIDDYVAPISQKENSMESKLGADDKSFSNKYHKKKEHIHSEKFKNNTKLNKSHNHNASKKQEKNNLEALELETEQTLKDINKWLELTPHMSEFGSANSSPSRYIIDELDTVPTRTDDFIRTVPILQENQENDQHLNSQFDALKNETKIGLIDQTASNKHIKNSSLISEQKLSKMNVKELKSRKSTKLLNYVPTRKRELHRNIDRLQPGKSKGNLLNAVSTTKRNEIDVKTDIIASKVKEVKNSLIVETNESGPKLSLGTVLDSEGFGIIQQHNFQDEKLLIEDNCEKSNDFVSINEQSDKTQWGEVKTNDDSINKQCSKSNKLEEVNDKKNDEPKPNLSAWFKAFGIPKKTSNVTLNASKDGTYTDPGLSVTNNFSQPAMRQRKSSTGSTTSELSSVSQDPDSPRITIDESYNASYKSPLQLPIVCSGSSPKPGSFSPKQQSTSNYEINGPIKVGFYQDTTKCSPDKSPRENANTTQQYSTSHRPLSNPTSLQPSFSYYTKTDCSQSQSTTTNSFVDTCQKPSEHQTQSTSNYNSNNPSSPYQSEPMSPYLQSPNSPYTHQSSQTAIHQYPGPIIEPQKTPYSLTTTHKNTIDPHSEKEMSNNEKESTQPPTCSTPQFLPHFKQSNEIRTRSEPEPSGNVNLNSLNNYNTPSTNEISNIKDCSNDQNTWSHQGLYGSAHDKNLFPLSLSNTVLNSQNQSQSDSNVTQSNTENLCNNQPYGLFDFDIRQKKSIDCINSTTLSASDPIALVSKNQDTMRKQQPISSSSSFESKSSDYTNAGSDRSKRNETFVTHENKNSNSCLTFGNQNRPQSKSNISHSNVHQQQNMYGNNRTNYMESGVVDLKSSTIPQTSLSKSLEGTSHFNSYGNSYGGHGQQHPSQSADFAMTASPQHSIRYTDLSRQTPTSHQHQQMDAYKNSAYIRNFASMMAEMGMPSTTQNPYSQSMAHQFVKSFHQATTAALQQFLPGTSMTTTAYSKNSRDGEIRSASSKIFPSVSQQTVISQYIGGNSTNQASLTSQQQQHMATYQQKFSEAANISQTPCLPQGNIIDIKHSTSKKSVKSGLKKNKQASQLPSTISQSDNILNPGINHGGSTYQSQTSAHNFSSYVPNMAGKSSDSVSNSVGKVGSSAGSGSSGSAFNFTTTSSLTLPGPPGMVYGEPPSYLEDFRGSSNPYYPIPTSTNHRNPTDITSEKNPATTSTVSTPYHQFLQHPTTRSGYPFMNPSFDPQQWNLRDDQLRAQMMLASNPYSQSGFPRHLWG